MVVIRPLNDLASYLNRLLHKRLWLQVIVAIILGLSAGLLLNPANGILDKAYAKPLSEWLNLPGSVFMRMVQMIMIPLIFTSILTGIVSNNSDQLKRMGTKLIAYFLTTTSIAITIGATVMLWWKPGLLINDLGGFLGNAEPESIGKMESSSVPEAISNLIPSNPLAAFLSGEMLGVVIFTIIVAIAITQLREELAGPLVRVAEAIQKICMIVVSWAMLLVPYAVFGMMAALMITLGFEVLLGLGQYMLAVVVGLIILLMVYLIMVWVFGKMNPIKFLSAIREPQLLAFSTASSAAVMPLSMKAADKELGVASRISDFIIPVGATINMDGTALFQCATTLFLAQAYGIELTVVNLILLTVTVVGASVGTPSIPGGGVIILASVLSSAGIPTAGLVVIIGVDRILGMFRTTLNVTGDLVACLLFNRWFGNKEPALKNE